MSNVQKINKNYQSKSRITSKNNKFTFIAYPAFLPGESHGRRGLMGCGLWGCKESDTTKQLTHTHTIMFKEGKETISKELNKRMRIMSQQIENNNKEIEIIKTHQIEI